jgi:NADH pyrophosphatase NudC (nudix superfamily)
MGAHPPLLRRVRHAHAALEGERCCAAACGHSAAPRISPAMMVLVRKGEQVLLAMHTNSPYKRYTALAGFPRSGRIGRGSHPPRSV